MSFDAFDKDDQPVTHLPCTDCQQTTLKAVLGMYGRKCEACYNLYCREPQNQPDVGDKRKDGPKAWAYALKARHEAGERLSRAQIVMYKEVVR